MCTRLPVNGERKRVRVTHPTNPLDSWVGYLTDVEIYRYRLAGYIIAEA